MSQYYVLALLFTLLGITAIAAALLGWSWFFETESGKLFVKYLGLRGARIFYGILGTLVIAMAYFIAFG